MTGRYACTALARLITLVFALTASPVGAEAMPAQAFIRTGEHGQALLMTRLNECYAVTPAHVMSDAIFANLVGGTSQAPRGEGDLLQTFGYDLSILRVTGDLTKTCGAPLSRAGNLDKQLASVSQASVASVNPDGSLTRRNVSLVDVGLLYIRIRPNTENDQLFKGLSGSLLLTDDAPAGILMSVDPDTGEGRALRYDRALETLRPFFGLSAGKSAAAGAATSDGAQQSGSSAAPNVHRATVTSWTSAATDGAHRANNLTDEAGTATQWYAEPDGFPIEVVLELDGDKAQVVQEVVLVGEGVTPGARLPRDFELLISGTDSGNWIPLHTGTYFERDARKSIAFAPVRARRIMLRIWSHWGDPDAVGLSQIEVPRVR